ncbi:unnamed protein product [Mucor hiemalis]
MWSKRSNNKAPCTIFSTTTLSPRQIANKAYSLGCKKLDRDDKRSKQRYHVRERLLICNTITRAEEVLNARTRRTNRRVMAAEDEEEASSDEFSMKNNHHHHSNNKEHHSPLRSFASEDDEEDEEEEEESNKNDKQDIPKSINNSNNASSITSSIHNNTITPTSPTPLFNRDCRVTITNKNSKSINSSPIATII